jgi:hypothetical protein
VTSPFGPDLVLLRSEDTSLVVPDRPVLMVVPEPGDSFPLYATVASEPTQVTCVALEDLPPLRAVRIDARYLAWVQPA